MLRLRIDRALLTCCVMAFGAVAAGPAARAEKQPHGVVLSVETIGRLRDAPKWRAEFQGRLEDELRNAGFAVAPEHPSRLCHEAGCMAEIAAQTHGDLVVGSRVVNDGQVPPNFTVRVWAYDARRAGALRGDVERTYPNGTEADAAQALVKQLGEALTGQTPSPEVVKPATAAPQPAQQLPGVTTTPPEQRAPVYVDRPPFGMSRGQRWIVRSFALVLGALFVAGMVEGGIEVHKNGEAIDKSGNTSCSPNCDYHRDTTPGEKVYFSLGGAALVAGGVLAGIGWWPDKRVEVAPQVAPNGAKLTMQVHF